MSKLYNNDLDGVLYQKIPEYVDNIFNVLNDDESYPPNTIYHFEADTITNGTTALNELLEISRYAVVTIDKSYIWLMTITIMGSAMICACTPGRGTNVMNFVKIQAGSQPAQITIYNTNN